MFRRAALYGVPTSGAEWQQCYSALFSALENRFGKGRIWQRTNKYFDQADVADDVAVAVIQGLQGEGVRWLQANLELGIPTLVIDLAWLRRERGYWQASVGGLNNPPAVAPSADRFENLQLKVYPRIIKDYHNLIVGQIPGDKQHDLDDEVKLITWGRSVATQLKERDPKRRVFWRPHPKFIRTLGPPAILSNPGRIVKDFLREEHVGSAVVYNSTLGIELLRRGVSVVAQGPRTVYTDLVSSDIADLHTSYPGPDKVRSLLERLAYGQYKLTELAEWSTMEQLLSLHGITGDW